MSAHATPRPEEAAFDLEAYCRRIGYEGALTPSRKVLRNLHVAHVGSIPFENVDVLLGKGIRLDFDSLWKKMVVSRRGGYCFEQNTLFKAVLEASGFKVQGLAARVLMGAPVGVVRPRTHMALRVQAEGEHYLADVGFGGDGLLEPLPMISGREFNLPLVSFRLRETFGQWTLSAKFAGAWTDLYTFTLEPQQPVDYELANYYTSTHPDSKFRRTLTAQRVLPGERSILRTRELTILREDGIETREVASAAQATHLLRERFGIELDRGDVLPEALFSPEPTSTSPRSA